MAELLVDLGETDEWTSAGRANRQQTHASTSWGDFGGLGARAGPRCAKPHQILEHGSRLPTSRDRVYVGSGLQAFVLVQRVSRDCAKEASAG